MSCLSSGMKCLRFHDPQANWKKSWQGCAVGSMALSRYDAVCTHCGERHINWPSENERVNHVWIIYSSKFFLSYVMISSSLLKVGLWLNFRSKNCSSITNSQPYVMTKKVLYYLASVYTWFCMRLGHGYKLIPRLHWSMATYDSIKKGQIISSRR